MVLDVACDDWDPLESSELPSGWVDVLNRLEAVVVPCSWLETVFRDAGVTAALYRVPLGIKECYVPHAAPRGGRHRPAPKAIVGGLPT